MEVWDGLLISPQTEKQKDKDRMQMWTTILKVHHLSPHFLQAELTL